jgi:hypothetical protein
MIRACEVKEMNVFARKPTLKAQFDEIQKKLRNPLVEVRGGYK